MINYIFDLDFTLYSNEDIDETNTILYYESFHNKPFLNKLLNSLEGNKYIFSNGNKEHVDFVLKKMNLENIFKNVANADEYKNRLKPNKFSYNYVIEKFKIKNDDLNIFFEDSLINLKTAKKYNWITVYISDKDDIQYEYVDFIFPTIEKALLFFMNKSIYKYLKN
jgi:HAD superfamily hydrolase (TIGR01509 family)